MGVDIQLTTVKYPKKHYKKAKWPKITITIFFILILLVNCIGIYVGNKFYNIAFRRDTGKTVNQFEEYRTTFNEKRYNSLRKEEIFINSKYDYRLYGIYIKNSVATENTMIIVHGLGGSKWADMSYADMYLDKGFNVLVYDSRDHGESGGKDISYGFYEKYDLDKWASWVQARNKNGIIGVHGISMGASTALLQSELNEANKKVSFYVIDCPYSNLKDEFIVRLKNDFHITNPFLLKGMLFYSEKFTSLRSGFTFDQVSPIEAIKKVTVPIMFIHGASDSYVPTSMAEDLYKIKKGMKELYISPNAGHAKSFSVNKDEYKNKVYKFIDNVVNSKQEK